MIVLDTNILSELMKVSQNPKVFSWFLKQEVEYLFITSITIAEIHYGLSVLPLGARRSFLEESFQKAINETFCHRILFFDDKAAYVYGKLMASRKNKGRPMSILDAQIASIAKVHQFILATRNIVDFIDSDLPLINPFSEDTQ